MAYYFGGRAVRGGASQGWQTTEWYMGGSLKQGVGEERMNLSLCPQFAEQPE